MKQENKDIYRKIDKAESWLIIFLKKLINKFCQNCSIKKIHTCNI